METIRKLIYFSAKYKKSNLWPPVIIGLCESIMYPVTLLAGEPNFIGIWLLFKAASQWARWGQVASTNANMKNISEADLSDENRRRYMHFLIGNAFSIIAGSATYGVIKIVIHW